MKRQLLILDDQIQYGRSLERVLRRDYDLVLATSVEEAKEHLTDNVDVVISDVRLDESNPSDRQGLSFVSWVRNRKRNLPIISMSAVDDPSLEQQALAAGANKFLRKPIVVSKLRELLVELTRVNS